MNKAHQISVKKLQTGFWLFVFLWTVYLLSLFLWVYSNEKKDAVEMAKLEARTSFEKDVMYREWVSHYGGIYIRNPESIDTSGAKPNYGDKSKFIHIPPEKMISMVYEMAEQSHDRHNHITSLIPMNKKNAPDEWEKKALQRLEAGETEAFDIQTRGGEKVLRYMGRLVTEESCLKCHYSQGYKIGDVRGGISITVPFAPYDEICRSHSAIAITGISIIWLIGILIISFMFKAINKEIKIKTGLFSDLKNEKQYFENLFQNSPEGIILVDEKSNILRVNSGFCELFGYKKEELIGNNVDKLIADKNHRNEALSITKLFTNERIGKTFESIRIHKEGHPIEVSILGAPIIAENGQLQVLGIYRNISHQKQIERKLKESGEKYKKLSDRLSETNSLKDLLLDIITHDLKNPAGLISGAVNLLKQEYPHMDLIEMVDQGAENILKVIENATALSKLSMDENISMQKINIVPIIHQTVKSFQQLIQEADMSIEVDLPRELIVDAHKIIEEVFKNYISNAIKYATEGRKIRISSKTEGSHINIEVSDNGKTIQPEFRNKIFTRSFQLDAAKGRGSGLGLSIVSKIASAHHAKVGVIPNLPTGNIFFISFPVTSS